mmetsp:Transcript_3189/g.7516  ORF Transcript_3189/g.7516 Transcript_3189/m.7516 type:complete len:253 (-) Transcript_3189:161-919(-)
MQSAGAPARRLTENVRLDHDLDQNGDDGQHQLVHPLWDDRLVTVVGESVEPAVDAQEIVLRVDARGELYVEGRVLHHLGGPGRPLDVRFEPRHDAEEVEDAADPVGGEEDHEDELGGGDGADVDVGLQLLRREVAHQAEHVGQPEDLRQPEDQHGDLWEDDQPVDPDQQQVADEAPAHPHVEVEEGDAGLPDLLELLERVLLLLPPRLLRPLRVLRRARGRRQAASPVAEGARCAGCGGGPPGRRRNGSPPG